MHFAAMKQTGEASPAYTVLVGASPPDAAALANVKAKPAKPSVDLFCNH